MKITIFDINQSVIDACNLLFQNSDFDVECVVKSFSEIKADYVVTAGNSHGWMSGGIDLAVRNCLGPQIEEAVQDEIKWSWNNFLPVGKLITVPFRQIHADEDPENVQHLIYAPTMEEPGTRINKEDIYLVACKILRFMLTKPGKSVAICGLGTATGGISPMKFADAIYKAYEDVIYYEQ